VSGYRTRAAGLALLSSAALVTAPQLTGLAAAQTTPAHAGATTTPIKHLVVIFQENVSFDH